MRERTMVFWIGLILASLAGLELFGIIWLIMVVAYWERPTAIEFWIRSPIIPAIVAGVGIMLDARARGRITVPNYMREKLGMTERCAVMIELYPNENPKCLIVKKS